MNSEFDNVFEPEQQEDEPVSPEVERAVRQHIGLAQKIMMEQGPMAFGYIPAKMEYKVIKIEGSPEELQNLENCLNDGWRNDGQVLNYKDFSIFVLCRPKEEKENR